MQKIHLTTFINAPREKVWDVMLGDATYREWTAAFNPGSYYKGEWVTGAKILFLGPNPETGGEGGMVSRIAEARRPSAVSIEHLGLYGDGKEITDGPEVEGWKGAFENYTFAEKDGGTELTIDMDIKESEKETMEKMWRAGLEKLKGLAEAVND
jgi:uncharacterized protein YndB with AHSA1/START domain